MLLLCLMFLTVVVHISLAPYTKVEESFNIQAIHDILHHKLHIDQYDHLQYPGVVPRTFIAPLAVAIVTYPAHLTLQLMGYPKFASQIAVRVIISLLGILAFYAFHQRVAQSFGKDVAKYLVLLTITQFHFIFYFSRPLQNIFALFVVLVCYKYWLSSEFAKFIWTSAFVILIFRSELAMLLGLLLLIDLIDGRFSFIFLFKHGLAASILSVSLTITIDSFFWQRFLWPELEVLYFNTILNQSAAWGTLPIYAYFILLLPKALGLPALFLITIGLYADTRIKRICIPVFAYVALYSILPHKELRFVLYVIPVLNLAAARGWAFLANNVTKKYYYKILYWASFFCLFANATFSAASLLVSSHNYYGGVALHKFHKYVPPSSDVSVHLSNLVCQNGASRFLQANDNWIYSKEENLLPGSKQLMKYTHLLVDMSTDYSVYRSSHTVIFTVRGFSGVTLDFSRFPYVHVGSEPKVLALQLKTSESVSVPLKQSHKI